MIAAIPKRPPPLSPASLVCFLAGSTAVSAAKRRQAVPSDRPRGGSRNALRAGICARPGPLPQQAAPPDKAMSTAYCAVMATE